MALNIPMPDLPGNSLMKGLDTGSTIFSRYMQPIIQQQQMEKKNNPLRPSGDVANALYVEQIKRQFGENSPEYMKAKTAHDISLQNRQSLMDWRKASTNLAPYRVTSPLGRSIAEAKGQGALDIFGNRNKGQQQYDAQGNPVYTPPVNKMDEETKKAYEADIAKKTTDAAIRNKLPYAQNVETTFNNLNFDDLTTYSGLKGSAEYAKDFALAGLGNPSERFLNYNNSVNTASALSKQLRQFWGDSIQPSAMEKIDSLTNPSRWYKDPKVAKAQLEQLKKITDQELQNFRNAGTSPIKLNKLEFKDGQFSLNQKKNQGNSLNNQINETSKSNKPSDENEQFLKAISSQLIQIMPEATPENIKHTANATGKSIEQVTDELLQIRDAMMGEE